jgi:hypothetical protein
MMIYRVLEQGWNEEKALDEALKIGLRGDELKKFAQSYIAQNKARVKPPRERSTNRSVAFSSVIRLPYFSLLSGTTKRL